MKKQNKESPYRKKTRPFQTKPAYSAREKITRAYGLGFLLLENGYRLLQENFGRIIIGGQMGTDMQEFNAKQAPYAPKDPYMGKTAYLFKKRPYKRK